MWDSVPKNTKRILKDDNRENGSIKKDKNCVVGFTRKIIHLV